MKKRSVSGPHTFKVRNFVVVMKSYVNPNVKVYVDVCLVKIVVSFFIYQLIVASVPMTLIVDVTAKLGNDRYEKYMH